MSALWIGSGISSQYVVLVFWNLQMNFGAHSIHKLKSAHLSHQQICTWLGWQLQWLWESRLWCEPDWLPVFPLRAWAWEFWVEALGFSQAKSALTPLVCKQMGYGCLRSSNSDVNVRPEFGPSKISHTITMGDILRAGTRSNPGLSLFQPC